MKNIFLVAIAIVFFACSPLSLADSSDIEASNNQFLIQKISNYVDYTETGAVTGSSNVGKLDTETGYVPGYALTLTGMDRSGSHLYYSVEYDQCNGGTYYTGMNINGGIFGSVLSNSSALLTNFSGRFGKAFIVTDNFMLTPYAELGSHKWDRGVNSGESYAHKWLGVGGMGQFSPVSQWVISVNAIIGRTEGSAISVNSGNGITGFSAALGNSLIYKAGLSADYAFTKTYHGNIGVDYTSFKYASSTLVPVNGGSLEPDSQTNYTTFKIGLGYAF